MSTAARCTVSGSRTSGWSICAERLTTASRAAMTARAYGCASCTRCCALMIRDAAMSSWARVILAMDWIPLIRCLTARSCAPMLRAPALLFLRRRLLLRLMLHVLVQLVAAFLVLRDGPGRLLVFYQRLAATDLESPAELVYRDRRLGQGC